MNNKKTTEEELTAWLEGVHFGSCCSDSVDQLDGVEQVKMNKNKQQNKTACYVNGDDEQQ